MSNEKTPFDSEDIAAAYDKWFETPVGKAVAREELQLFWEKMAPLGSGVPLRVSGGGCGSGGSAMRFQEALPLNVLEVGSGTGWLMEKIWKSPFRIQALVGVEPALHMRRYAMTKFSDVETDVQRIEDKIKGNERFVGIVDGDAESLPFGDALFDRVVFFTSMEFVPHPEKAIEEALRVLKPGGRVVILVLNGDSQWMKKRMGKGVFAYGHFPTVEEFRSLLGKYGGDDISGAVYWMPVDEDTLPPLLSLRAWWNKLWGLKNAVALAGYIQKT